jgi:hypothetical protein
MKTKANFNDFGRREASHVVAANVNNYVLREESHVVAANDFACRGDDAHRNQQFAAASEYYRKVKMFASNLVTSCL